MRFLTALITAALVIGGLGTVAAPPAAAAPAGITLDKKAPASVLLGDPVPYTLTASNPAGNVPLYNVSFSDVLPKGFEYVGPTDPASAGEPKISPDGRVLTWTNVTDLQPGSSYTINFEARLNPVPTTIVPVDENTATVAGSVDERKVPKFGPDGAPVTDPDVVSSTDTTQTKRAPFVVEKRSTNSPEGELLRGVHDQRSTYTLTVRNNKAVPTDKVTLTDYLPAQLEFLGCGNKDNSQVVTEEYPGSGPLGDPAVDPTPCPTPLSVETVDSPQGVPGLGDLNGVYTAVTWEVGNLAAGDEQEIAYVAGIPLFANTTKWAGQEPPTDGPQGSNLDNNNGDPTRELADEQPITNLVSATGFYTGETQDNPVVATEKHTVTVEDVRMQKAVDSGTFTPGGTAVFTMTIDASEYVNASDIVVTDTLPDGYCPLGATDTTYWPEEPSCTATASDPKPSPGFSDVSWTGTAYRVVFDAVSVDADKSTQVTLPARMLATYRATNAPTVAGDGFVNEVDLTAVTTPIKGVEGDPQKVGDASQATQGTSLLKISKEIKPRAAPPGFPDGMKCDPTVKPFYESNPDPVPTFRKSDVICFKLRVDFPKSIDTKGAVVTDFPPVDTEFVVDDDPSTGNNPFTLTGANNVAVTPDLSATKLVLTLGKDGFVPAESTFEATFAVRLLKPGTGTKPEITGNLMKMRTENTAGVAQSYRDEAEYGLVSPPDLAITKGVITTTAPKAGYPPGTDNKPVEQGSFATFRIDVANNPRDIPGADYSVRGMQVWDVLPPGIDCAAIDQYQYIKPGATTAADLTEHVTCDSGTIKWTFPSPDLADDYSIDSGQALSLLYRMAIPTPSSVGTDFPNTSGVRQYEAFTDVPGVTATYIPRDNIDPTQEDRADSPPLNDPSNVFINPVTVSKDADTSVTETNNDEKTQATIGETITYTYSARVPAGSTVYRGELSDTLPTGISLVSVDDWGRTKGAVTDKPAEFSPPSSTGTLTFPARYENISGQDETFFVTVTALVGQEAASCGQPTCTIPQDETATGVKRTNTATFVSYPDATSPTRLERTATYDIFVVQPRPTITKSANPTSVNNSATPITYTLTARTPVDRPPLHDVTVLDCVPDELTVGTVNNGGTLGTDSNCQTTNKVAITWTFAELTPGVDRQLTYSATIKAGSPADVRFRNTVGMQGSSLKGADANERTYLTGANAEVFIGQASITKTVTPSPATIGQTVTYSVEVRLPDATYKNLAVLDTLPPYINAANLVTTGVTCQVTDANYQNPASCASTPAFGYSFLPATGAVATGQTVGWSFDPLPNQDRHRIIRIAYTARVSNLTQNTAGTQRTNTARARYGYTTKPTTVTQANTQPYTQIGTSSRSFRIAEPNVQIDKTVEDQKSITVLPDDTFTYRVTVGNPQRAGGVQTSDAYAVRVRDCLPDGITVVSPGTGTVGTDSACPTTAKAAITWPVIDTLTVGSSQEYSFTAELKGDTSTAQVNTATALEWSSLPADAANADIRTYGPLSSSATVTPVLPDVRIDKKASAALAYIGEPYEWTIEVTNPSTRVPAPTAYGLSVTDTLPANWIFEAGSTLITLPDGTTATTNPDVDPQDPTKLTWSSIADLPATKKMTIRFRAIPQPAVATPPPGVGTTVPQVNAAGTTWFPGKPGDGWTQTGPRTATAQTAIAAADLALAKTAVTDYTPALQDPNNVIPGTQFKWKLTVTNNGDDKSVGPYVVADTLPTGNTYVGFQGADWQCAQDQTNKQEVTCTHPDVAPDGLAKNSTLPDLFLIVSVDETAPPSMENSATVTGKTFDPNLTNNTSKDTVTPLPPDVQIEKFASEDVAYIGEPYSWRLEITNPSDNVPGPTAYSVSASDTLPSNWTYKAGSTLITLPDGSTVTPEPTENSGTLTWSDIADLPVNQKITITFDAIPGSAVVTDPGVGLTVPHVNTASTSWYPGTPTSNWDLQTSKDVTAQTKIAEGDLQLMKSHVTDYQPPLMAENDEVIPGTTFNWKFVTRSNGPDPFVGPYVVTDTLPAGLTYQGFSGKNWSCDQDQVDKQKLTCTHPDIPGGLAEDAELPALFIEVFVQLDAPASIANTATVTGRTYDRDPANNTSTDLVTTRPQADLAIEKSSSGTYVVGEQVEYTLAVTNLGPSTSRKPITVTDTLPAGLSIVSYDAGPWDCSPASGPATTVTCVLDRDLPPQTQAPLIKVLTEVVESPGPSATNCAVVTPTTEDPVEKNNQACVTDTVVSEVQLGIAKKTTGANPVVAGEQTEFTITVTNQGPAEAKNVQVQDVLQAGLTATSASGPGWTCDVGTGTVVTCTRKTFPVTSSPSDIVVKAGVDRSVPGGTQLQNTATVTTTSPQPGGQPEPATSTVDVIAKSDLAVVKSHEGGPWTIGKQGVWRVAVTNNGPSDNPGPITVVDNLPRGNEFVSAAGSGWECSAAGRMVTCVRAAGLQVGETAEFSLRVAVVRGAFPEVVNPAEVTSPVPDTNPDNNRATDSVRVAKAKQTANPLPKDPTVIPSAKTKQGQKIRTKVRCVTLKSSAAGEVSFCKVRRLQNGTVRVRIEGSRPVRVIVTQFARGNAEYKPWKRVKKYIVRP